MKKHKLFLILTILSLGALNVLIVRNPPTSSASDAVIKIVKTENELNELEGVMTVEVLSYYRCAKYTCARVKIVIHRINGLTEQYEFNGTYDIERMKSVKGN